MINQVRVSNWYPLFIIEWCHWCFSNNFICPSLCFTGIDLQESGHSSWLAHALFEYTLGMKLSFDNQTGRSCLFENQSTGNSYF